jgi:hypothetical protein
MNPTSKGFATSEFASMLAGIVTVVGLFFGISGVGDHLVVDAISQLIATAVAGVFAMVTIGMIILQYVKGRTDLKKLLVEDGLLQDDTVPQVTPVAVSTTPDNSVSQVTLGDGSVPPVEG